MKKTIIISGAVVAVAVIGVVFVLSNQKNPDTVSVISDSVEVAQDNIVEDVVDVMEEPEPEEITPTTPEQETVEPEKDDIVPEEPETEPTDEALTDITVLDKIMYAQSAVNTRSGPSTDYEKVGGLTTNQEVHVIGQSNLTKWFQIDVEGEKQFVSNNYLADAKVEIQQTASQSQPKQPTESKSQLPDPKLLEELGLPPQAPIVPGVENGCFHGNPNIGAE